MDLYTKYNIIFPVMFIESSLIIVIIYGDCPSITCLLIDENNKIQMRPNTTVDKNVFKTPSFRRSMPIIDKRENISA